MKASELIKALQEKIESYGDFPVNLRIACVDRDIEIEVVYGDDDEEKIFIADDYFT